MVGRCLILSWSVACSLAVVAVDPLLPSVPLPPPLVLTAGQAAGGPPVGMKRLLEPLGIQGPVSVVVHSQCPSCTIAGDEELLAPFQSQGVVHVVASDDPGPLLDLARRAGQKNVLIRTPAQMVAWSLSADPRRYDFDASGTLVGVRP